MSEQLPNTTTETPALSSEDQLLADIESILPYITVALESGLSVREILMESIGCNADGSPTVTFDTFARMMARVPVVLEANEDGTPIVVAYFTDVTFPEEV